MNDAVDSLPERFRLAVWLHEAEGFSWSEAGVVIGTPAWLARAYGSIGLWLLRSRLAPPAAMSTGAAGFSMAGAASLERAPVTLVARIEDMVRDWNAAHQGCGPEEPGESPAFARSPAPAHSLWVAFAAWVAILMSAMTMANR